MGHKILNLTSLCLAISLFLSCTSFKMADSNLVAITDEATIKLAAKSVGIADDYPYLGMVLSHEWVIIIHRENGGYVQYIFTGRNGENFKIFNRSVVNSQEVLMSRAFKENYYHEGYIDFSTDYFSNGYDLSIGGQTYFVFFDENGKKHGEAKLTLFVKPNPIEQELYLYLTRELVAAIEEYSRN